MKYVQPYGVSDENAPYINGNPSIGVAGSIPPSGAFESPQREIVNAIASGGLVPSPSDMTQLSQVLSKIGVRFAIDTSSAAGSIVITPIPAIIDLSVPTMIAVKVGHDCPGASTITYGTAAQYAAGTQVTKPVRRGDGAALQEGDYSNGGMLLLMFDGVNFQLVASGLIASGSGGSGTPGAPGQPGSQIYSGAAVPDTGLGINDDYYIRTTTLDMYKRVSGSWGIILNFRTEIPGVTLPATYDGATNKYSVRKGSLTEGGYGRVANSAEALAGTSATIDGVNLPWITPELLAMVITDRLAAYRPDVSPTAIGAYRGATVHYTFCDLLDVVSGASIAAYRSSIVYNGHLIHDASPALWPGSWRAVANTWSDGYANAWIFQRVA